MRLNKALYVSTFQRPCKSSYKHNPTAISINHSLNIDENINRLLNSRDKQINSKRSGGGRKITHLI